MRRREFIAGLGAAAWPLAARVPLQAQPQGERVRRVGVASGFTEADGVGQAYVAALKDGLAKLGWIEGRNLRLDVRWGGDSPALTRTYAAELANLAPDVIVTIGGTMTRAVKQQTQAIPIVFALVGDPSTNRIVTNIARPDGNLTGVTNIYNTIAGKWLELLKEASPGLKRVALIYNPGLATDSTGFAYFPSIEEASRVLSIPATDIPYRDAVDIVRGVDAFAAQRDGGLMTLPPSPTAANRKAILRLTVEHRLPAIYQDRAYVAEGGLMAYGPNAIDLLHRVSVLVDRILRGVKVSELPVEFSTKFQLVINLRTAKAIGLTIPPSFVLRADEVIE